MCSVILPAMQFPLQQCPPHTAQHSVSGSQGNGPDEEMFAALSTAYAQYAEISAMDIEGARARLQELEQACHNRGLFGHTFLNVLRLFQGRVAWERMVPDEFTRFYRFAFHLCKQPNRKHVQVDVALEAWKLLLTLRFRLLDKWCDFVRSQKTPLTVVNEDQWRQVLEFSRTIHEDLSNYDPNSAWACVLDEFVEHLRNQRQSSRSLSREQDMMAGGSGEAGGDMDLGLGVPVSPRTGSKRRSPDMDTVVERLSAFPLPSTASDDLGHAAQPHAATHPHAPHLQQTGSAIKRQCITAANTRHSVTSSPTSLAMRPMAFPASPSGLQGMPLPQFAGGYLGHGPLNLGHGPLNLGHGVVNLGQGTPQGSGVAGGVGTPTEQPQPFTFELPMVSVSTRRHIKPRRSNVSELVNHTVSGALFLNQE